MQILFDVRLLGRGGTSGIEEYTQNLLRSLLAIDRGNDYSLFYNGFTKLPISSFQFPIKEEKIIDWKIPNKIFDFSSRFFNFPAVDRFIKTDLVFSPHFNILKSQRAPQIITFHDLSFMHHSQFFSWKQKFWHWLQDIKKQAKRASKIIAVSEFTRSDLINLLGVPPEKISVVYSGISEEFCKIATPSTVLTRQNSAGARNDNRPYILYLGTLEPRKNVPAIIRAFNILKKEPVFEDWQLVIAGKPGWLYRQILKEAHRSPYRNDIIFRGAVRAEDRVSLYNLAKVFVYPSFFEGFGFPPLEAQACGCPVVVSDRTSMPEVIGESGLRVNPWKTEDLASAIKEISLNGNLREKLINAGLENAKKFSWTKTAEQTIKIFNEWKGNILT